MIASCKTSGAQQQEYAELESTRLALGLACHIKSLLQQLDIDQLGHDVHTTLRTSSWKEKLAPGRPIAQQLGLSRRNKHKQLKGQLQLSKVHPNKNLAHSLSHNASDNTMLAKLRIETEAAKTGALFTVRCPCLASFVCSSSLLVGMVAAKPSQMEKPQLRPLAFPKSVSFVRSCHESLSRNFADKRENSLTLQSLSLQTSNSRSLTLDSWSFPTASLTLQSLSRTRDRFHSLTRHSLSLTEGNLQSLTGQSLSLTDENGFQSLSFREVSLEDGKQELEKNLAHNLLKRRAETNSFSRISLQEKQPTKEAETNSFCNQSFRGILSLNHWWRIFLLCSFQLVCAALLLGNCSFTTSFPIQSLQPEQLVAAYSSSFKQPSLQQEDLDRASFRRSFEHRSLQKDELEIACLLSPTRAHQLDSLEQMKLCKRASFINQLDLDTSLSVQRFSLLRGSISNFEFRALSCAALLYKPRISNSQLQVNQVQSFQLTRKTS